ncbi:3-oxoacyl-ACP reductase FabG [Zooshikella ganghwensis]|uniref:3-oxoacyl-ACP reductase FabG n=1 Tax=Zooshikella ganghwensis TaxID=202772 RepID=A0A4P9VHW3_9GAMM|nr:3-oxoacyl-ACP reductase FabG [Zooshikella ganghwensis]RDH42713.1 3-oxoacyl-ACP reductase FabG [Zooshikella ganghwensis]
MSQFSYQVVVVTGGTKGIGKGIVDYFAAENATVVFVGRDQTQGEQLTELYKKQGKQVVFFQADLTDKQCQQELVAYICNTYGKLDVLCCCAGIYPSNTMDKITESEWDTVLNTNLKSVFFTIKGFLPLLQQQKFGRVVLMSSITGPYTGYPGWTHYGASKAAMLGFMRSAALELVSHNVTINAVLPGNIITEALLEQGNDYIDSVAQAIPTGKLGTPYDIARAVAFFASKDASFITGQTLVVDGGQLLPEGVL